MISGQVEIISKNRHERAGPQVTVDKHSRIEAAAVHTSTVRRTFKEARKNRRIHHRVLRPCAWDSVLCSNQYIAISASKHHHLYLPSEETCRCKVRKEAIAELFKNPGRHRPRKTCSALLMAPQRSAITSKPRTTHPPSGHVAESPLRFRNRTNHVGRLCCSRALQAVLQGAPLGSANEAHCRAARSMAPAG